MPVRFAFLAVIAPLLLAQPPVRPDTWAPLRFLVGSWSGTSKGQPGTGTSERTYEFVLGSRYLQVRNRSVYEPQPGNPKGEVHEDLGLISYDRSRKRFVFRQFHPEGFVNQYTMEDPIEERTLVFTTEAIENIPPGWRARETYRIVSSDEFVEIFELAEPGKPFEIYAEQRLRRASAAKPPR